MLVFGLGVAPFLIAILASNYVRFGDVTKTGYHLAYPTPAILFSTPLANGLRRLLADGEVGLLWFSPWVILLPWAWVAAWRRYRAECLLSMAMLAEGLFFFAKYKAWHGGWAFGPRMLTPCLPFAAPEGSKTVRAAMMDRDAALPPVPASVALGRGPSLSSPAHGEAPAVGHPLRPGRGAPSGGGSGWTRRRPCRPC